MSAQSLSTEVAHPRSLWSRALLRLAAIATVSRHRKALGRLDPHLLKDIGLTTEEAQAELLRPIWDVPTHWRD